MSVSKKNEDQSIKNEDSRLQEYMALTQLTSLLKNA